jgi:hypothetical protein
VVKWLPSIIEARFLVASLGEIASPLWWRSEATSVVGKRMLERLYPRTFLAASLETASRAACIEHDLRIGRLGAYHLFRLPSAYEAAIHDQLQLPTTKNLLHTTAALDGVEQILGALSNLAGNENFSMARGPVKCGTIDDLRSIRPIQRMCSAYVSAFRGSGTTYPYLEEVQP